jgi:hypothetical protein
MSFILYTTCPVVINFVNTKQINCCVCIVHCLHVSLIDLRNSVNNNKAFDLFTDTWISTSRHKTEIGSPQVSDYELWSCAVWWQSPSICKVEEYKRCKLVFPTWFILLHFPEDRNRGTLNYSYLSLNSCCWKNEILCVVTVMVPYSDKACKYQNDGFMFFLQFDCILRKQLKNWIKLLSCSSHCVHAFHPGIQYSHLGSANHSYVTMINFFIIPFYLHSMTVQSANCVKAYAVVCRSVFSSAPL